MSILGIIAQKESSGIDGQTNPIMTSSGNAMGLYQITSGTWSDFAPKAGVSLIQYPTALGAPADVQTAVANQIPLSRWAPSTVAAVQAQYPGLDTSQTVGNLSAQVGDSSGSGAPAPTGGTAAASASGLTGEGTSWLIGLLIRGATVMIGVAVLIVGLSSLNSGRSPISIAVKGTKTVAKAGAALAA